MACDCENPCRECKGNGSECSMDPAECGHAVLPADDNLLERAFMARIRADEHRADLKALQSDLDDRIAVLQQEFDEREDIIALKRRIDRCEEEQHNCIEQAKAAGISKQGNYLLKIRTRKARTVIPKLFFAKHGAEAFIECSTVAIGKAESLLGKAALDECCEVEVKEIGVSVEYERPEAAE
jgi:hypothetical protein